MIRTIGEACLRLLRSLDLVSNYTQVIKSGTYTVLTVTNNIDLLHKMLFFLLPR